MSSIQLAHSKDVTLTHEQMELLRGILEHVAEWLHFSRFDAGFVIYGDVVVARQSEPVRIVIEGRKEYTFELRIQRPGKRETAVTAATESMWLSTRWFVEQPTELPD